MEDIIMVRQANIDDVPRLLQIVPQLDAETEFVMRIPGEFKLSAEDRSVFLVALYDGVIHCDLFLN